MLKTQFRNSFVIMLLLTFTYGQDWGGLEHYRSANTALGPPAQGEQRVVFMGNSITQGWAKFSPEFFSRNNFICRGISGQTSPQMLLRFRTDVIDLKPSMVVILAGTNDIAENTGPLSNDDILGNIVSMAELARANGITPILASVLPAKGFRWRPDLRPAERIITLNKLIEDYAISEGFTYLDYHSSMVDAEGGLLSIYTGDGVHPNKMGYEHMESLASRMINKALRK